MRCARLCVGLLLLSGACGGGARGPEPQAEGTSGIGSGTAALISDERHSGGTEGFLWLPPIVARPRALGTFVDDLPVAVEIRALDARGRLGATIAVFTRTTGPRRERLRVDASCGCYRVDWDTDDYDLSPSVAYRIRVLLGTRELGFADVDLVKKKKQARLVDRDEYVALVDGRELHIKFRVESEAVRCTASCDDQNPCTTDRCDPVQGCLHAAVADGPFAGSAPTSCGAGACARTGRTECRAGRVTDTCTAGTPARADATCDGADDDCDGVADEDYLPERLTCGPASCQGVAFTSCIGGSVVSEMCTPPSCAPPVRAGGPRPGEDAGLWSDAGDTALNPGGNLQNRVKLFSWTLYPEGAAVEAALVHDSALPALSAGFGSSGWRVSAAARLTVAADQSVTIEEADGTPRTFTFSAAGGYRGQLFDTDNLTRAGDTFTLASSGGLTRTFTGGREVARRYRVSSVSFGYDASGALESIEDGTGRRATFTRGASGRYESARDPDGGQISFLYDTAGALTGAGVATGRYTFAYDAARRLSARTALSGVHTTRFTYDPSGRVQTLTGPDGARVKLTYHPGQLALSDSFGRVNVLKFWRGAVYETVGEDGLSTTISRDDSGRPIRVTDGYGRAKVYAYDARDDAVATTDELGRTSRFTWDARHNLLSARTPLGDATYTYAAFDLPETITDPLGELTRFGYDAAGNLTRVVDASGRTTFSAAYDPAGRPTRVAEADGRETTFAYDAAGATMTAPDGRTTRWTRGPGLLELRDRLGRTTRFAYDHVAGTSQLTLPSGAAIEARHDLAGRLLRLASAIGGTSEVSQLSWSAADLIATRTVNGVPVRTAAPRVAQLPEPPTPPCVPSCGSRCGVALADSCGGTIDCSCAAGLTCNSAGYCAGSNP